MTSHYNVNCIIYYIIPEHIDKFVASRTSLKIPSRKKSEFLYSHSFTKNSFHFLIIVESATYQVLLERP
jgi:hypothetical protein